MQSFCRCCRRSPGHKYGSTNDRRSAADAPTIRSSAAGCADEPSAVPYLSKSLESFCSTFASYSSQLHDQIQIFNSEFSNLVIFNLVIESGCCSKAPFSNYSFAKLPNYQILFRSRLADLLLQPFARVAHTLLLVWIGRTQSPHFRRHLSYLLAVNPAHSHLRLFGINGHRHPSRQGVLNRVRIAQREHDRVLALQLGAITNAHDLQFAVPAFRHPFHGVVHQRARQSVNGSVIVILAGDLDVTILLLQLHALGQMRLHLSFGSLDHYGVSLHFKLHSLRERNRLFSD